MNLTKLRRLRYSFADATEKSGQIRANQGKSGQIRANQGKSGQIRAKNYSISFKESSEKISAEKDWSFIDPCPVLSISAATSVSDDAAASSTAQIVREKTAAVATPASSV
ncbi:MAG: hypothetical protein HQL31_08815 [Planctomycetes bacterium]|nr:hypothetical protein [Planctomycetota bacterium]